MPGERDNDEAGRYVRQHCHFAWWSLLCFVSLGIMLEALHAFKFGWYLEEDHETRRLLWTLAHAHGTLLSLVHVAFAATVYAVPATIARGRRYASPCLMGASILLPGGFWLGGIFIYAGDPGVGIFLVPLGALLLFIGVLLTSAGVSWAGRSSKQRPAGKKKAKKGRASRSR